MAVLSDGHIFAGTNKGKIFGSTNGQDWSLVFSSSTLNPITALLADAKGNIYANATFQPGIIKSKNNGTTWDTFKIAKTGSLPYASVKTLCFDGNGNLFAGTSTSGAWISPDSGKTWDITDTTISKSISRFAVGTDKKIYAATNNGVYRLRRGKQMDCSG